MGKNHWQTKTEVNGQKIIKNLMEIGIQDGKTVAQDKDDGSRYTLW